MPLGRVELKGRTRSAAHLISPITGTPCAYYRYRVEEKRGHGKHQRWETVEQGDSAARGFYLEDETGLALVRPEGARIEISRSVHQYYGGLSGALLGADPALAASRWTRPGSSGRLRKKRFQEWRLHDGDPIYVLGVARERAGVAHEARDREAEKLRAVRSDPRAQIYPDRDGDGAVSEEEWEAAARVIAEETEREVIDVRIVVSAIQQARRRSSSPTRERHRSSTGTNSPHSSACSGARCCRSCRSGSC